MADITTRSLWVIESWSSKDGAKVIQTRLAQWVIDGEAKTVFLERREFKPVNGDPGRGSCKGFTLRDLQALKPHWQKIIEMMKNPPPLGQTPPADDDGETPF